MLAMWSSIYWSNRLSIQNELWGTDKMLELLVTCNMMQVVIFCFVIRYCCMKYEGAGRLLLLWLLGKMKCLWRHGEGKPVALLFRWFLWVVRIERKRKGWGLNLCCSELSEKECKARAKHSVLNLKNVFSFFFS